MPYCPKCKFEYRERIARCPDCGELLVAGALQPEEVGDSWRPDPETELVTLCRGIEPGEAEVMRQVLAREDIPRLVKTFGPITGRLTIITDGATHDYCTIMVAHNQLQAAQRALEEARSAGTEWPEGMEPEEGGDETEE